MSHVSFLLFGVLEELDLPKPFQRSLLAGIGAEFSAGRLGEHDVFSFDFLDHTYHYTSVLKKSGRSTNGTALELTWI